LEEGPPGMRAREAGALKARARKEGILNRKLSTREAARILGMRESRIRELVRSGLGRPARRGHRYAFSFQDLVILRAAHELIEKQVPAAGVARALAALARELPEERPLSGLRIFADGRRVAVCDGKTIWNPETGQALLDFEVDTLARDAARPEALETDSAALPVSAAEGAAQRERALALFDRALDLEDVDPVAACTAYGEALACDPELCDAYVNLGRLAFEAGDLAEAVRLYELALERTPEDPVVHYNLGLAVEDLRGPAAAIAHYQRALALDDAFADAHYNLAALSEKLDRREDALRHYNAYRRLTEPG